MMYEDEIDYDMLDQEDYVEWLAARQAMASKEMMAEFEAHQGQPQPSFVNYRDLSEPVPESWKRDLQMIRTLPVADRLPESEVTDDERYWRGLPIDRGWFGNGEKL